MSNFYESELSREIDQQIQELSVSKDTLQQRLISLEKDLNRLQYEEKQIQKTLLKKEEKAQDLVPSSTKPRTDLSFSHLDSLLEALEKQKSQFKGLILELIRDSILRQFAPLGYPVKGDPICGFGKKIHPLKQEEYFHAGIDIVASVGTPVISTAQGKVTFAGLKSKGEGLTIEIRHGPHFYTRYYHLKKINVHRGQKITPQQVIGFSGNSGIVKAAHLHYEILDGKKQPLNPVVFLYLGTKERKSFLKLIQRVNECKISLD